MRLATGPCLWPLGPCPLSGLGLVPLGLPDLGPGLALVGYCYS